MKLTMTIIIFRDTMLQALRFCLCGAGSKMAEPLKKQATTTLLGMLSSQEETTRSVASACLGAICGSLSDVEALRPIAQKRVGLESQNSFQAKPKTLCAKDLC
jgi:hypothetical protein